MCQPPAFLPSPFCLLIRSLKENANPPLFINPSENNSDVPNFSSDLSDQSLITFERSLFNILKDKGHFIEINKKKPWHKHKRRKTWRSLVNVACLLLSYCQFCPNQWTRYTANVLFRNFSDTIYEKNESLSVSLYIIDAWQAKENQQSNVTFLLKENNKKKYGNLIGSEGI